LEQYWRQLLDGFREPTRLPLEKRRNQSQPNAQRELSIALDATERIKGVARKEHLTLNSFVLGAWAMLLSRHVRQEDVVFGTTLAGRPTTFPGVERIAGLFVNTLPMRIRLDPDAICVDWLRDLQSQQIAMQSRGQSSLASIQRWSEVPSGTPLFESIVVFENYPNSGVQSDGPDHLEITDERYLEFSNYPLALLVVPGDSLRLIAIYDPGRLDSVSVDQLLSQLATAISNLALAPDSKLEDISLLSDESYRRVTATWNDTNIAFDSHDSIHRLIERRARESPRSLAVSFSGQLHDYQMLDERANQLAHLLLARGASNQSCIPIIAERSTDAVVAILAVLKAGAAYVPIDASFPDKRLAYVLDDVTQDDTDVRPLVITHLAVADRLSDRNIELVCLDDAGAGLNDFPSSRPDVTVMPSDLAYVIYTSGSTGRPKGVKVTHGNLLNSTLSRVHHYPESVSAYLVLSSFATDSSVAGIFWTLCTGGLLVLPHRRQEQDIGQLCSLIAEQRVSHLLAVPSLYRLILEEADARLLGSLRAVIVAGESCTMAVVAQHKETLPNIALYNEYGPTEGTVWATFARLDQQPDRITIGCPIANMQAYILDKRLHPVPVGVPGELCIAGAGVAAGYLNREDETKARFVENPFAPQNSPLLYKTGDRARFLADGAIEILGRVDNQVTIRGYRVEPEEIERALSSHPSISEAAVWLDHNQGGTEFFDAHSSIDYLLTLIESLDVDIADSLIAVAEGEQL
jgi:amino acid adenylation domain-containing protein